MLQLSTWGKIPTQRRVFKTGSRFFSWPGNAADFTPCCPFDHLWNKQDCEENSQAQEPPSTSSEIWLLMGGSGQTASVWQWGLPSQALSGWKWAVCGMNALCKTNNEPTPQGADTTHHSLVSHTWETKRQCPYSGGHPLLLNSGHHSSPSVKAQKRAWWINWTGSTLKGAVLEVKSAFSDFT